MSDTGHGNIYLGPTTAGELRWHHHEGCPHNGEVLTEARATPAEALPNDHACDWPGCAGQCHTGSTCPCHPEFESLGKHQQLTPRVMRGSSRGGRDAQGNHPR